MVECHVSLLNGGHLRPRPCPSLSFFRRSILSPQTMGWPPPTRSSLVAPPLQRPFYCGRQLSVDCCVLPLNGSHRRPRPCFPLYFLMGLVLAPQTREPTAAPPNPTVRALRKPVRSSGAMSWWCRWPPYGGKGSSQ